MNKIILFLNFFLIYETIYVYSEPPVNYLPPPQQPNKPPSSVYGPPQFQPGQPLGTKDIGNLQAPPPNHIISPSSANGFNNIKHPDSDQRPGSSYLPPNAPFNNRNSFNPSHLTPSGSYGPPDGSDPSRHSNNPRPNVKYGVPGIQNGNTNGYTNNKKPNFVSSHGFSGADADDALNKPTKTYGGNHVSNTNGGAPTNNGLNSHQIRANGNNRAYLPPHPEQNNGRQIDANNGYPGNGFSTGGNHQNGYNNDNDSEENTEPAKYQFEYDVNDPEFGTQFSHREERDGDRAIGEYNVLLPDGRKQIVRYEADSQGYRPQISYEGGNGGANDNNEGYPSSHNNKNDYATDGSSTGNNQNRLQDGYPPSRKSTNNGNGRKVHTAAFGPY